jgi:hypothetical protein
MATMSLKTPGYTRVCGSKVDETSNFRSGFAMPRIFGPARGTEEDEETVLGVHLFTEYNLCRQKHIGLQIQTIYLFID